MKINIKSIKINKVRRAVDHGKVKELAESIQEIGLLNPITITGNHALIAGAHRIAAYELLGKKEIEANALGISGIKAKLAEIDENLIRTELHYTERGDLLLERKQIYESLHPETKKTATLKQNRNAESAERTTPSFVKDASRKTGQSERSIQVDIQLSKDIVPEVKETVRRHDIPKTDALKLARMEPEKQRAVADKIAAGEAKSVDAASKTVFQEIKAEKKTYEKPVKIKDCKLFVSDIQNNLWQVADESVDYVITDPPYSKEYVYLYGGLSLLASRVLKPGGSLIVMCGQSYLPEVINELCKSMTYQWCMAYLTPGGISPSLWQKKTNTFWKPVLWFVKGKYKGDVIGDVLKSPPNDNDKKFHEWGQSLGGFMEILEKFTYPGQTILDPFLGGGTTGVAAVTMGRKFIGTDMEQKNIDVSRERIQEALCRE